MHQRHQRNEPRGHISTILGSLSRGYPQYSGFSGSVPALIPSTHHLVLWFSLPLARRHDKPHRGRQIPSTSEAVWSKRTAVAPGQRTRALAGEKKGSSGSRSVRRSSWTEARSDMFTLAKGWVPS